MKYIRKTQQSKHIGPIDILDRATNEYLYNERCVVKNHMLVFFDLYPIIEFFTENWKIYFCDISIKILCAD